MTDPEPFDGLVHLDPPPFTGRWGRFEYLNVGVLLGVTVATFGALCLIPACPDAPPAPAPATAPVVETDWSAWPVDVDPALAARLGIVPRPVNEAPEDRTPEPPLRAIEGSIPSSVTAP